MTLIECSEPSMAPVAVIGMACRLSGDVSSPDDLWTLVSRSRDGWCEVPEDRISSKAFYHPNPQKSGSFNVQGGYFMKRDVSKFDAPFFNITRQEAMAMDPQQRQLLEVSYEALENAGIPKERIAGSNMGVYIAGGRTDYQLNTRNDIGQTPIYDSTGNHYAIQAGRLSYYFDLNGPSLTLDTACSAGLYSIHAAVQSIRAGEADSAIVAGACLRLQPDDLISMSMIGIYNASGRTYAFDHRADAGFAPGEGVGCLILKPLAQALRDNDKIRSVIVNSGTNQDGKTAGLTHPSSAAQERLMRDVYARAAADPRDVGFVEAHGTGTKVGDPLEARALHRFLGVGRAKKDPLYIGSVKSNVGHLENASGIISVIKGTLILERGFILPNVNYKKPHPDIPLAEWNLKVPVKVRPWPMDKRYLSVNNFGFGGSNAHVVLERPPPRSLNIVPKDRVQRLFVLSAASEESLSELVSQVGIYNETHPEIFDPYVTLNMAFTLGERRSHLPYRVAMVADCLDTLGQTMNTMPIQPQRVTKAPSLAFVYTGQGAQWPTMGTELLQTHPVFAKAVQAASDFLRQIDPNLSLIEALQKDKHNSNIGEPHISQPACTAIQLGLTDLLKSWGITPSFVIGHSSGEIGAAYATGAITLEDAMSIAYYRGVLAAGLKTKHPQIRGAMIAVGTGPSEAQKVIDRLGLAGLAIACENSNESVTVSGDATAVDALATALESQGVFHRKLRVDVAYHSSHMQLVADEYMARLSAATEPPTCSNVQMYSSLLGGRLDSSLSLGPSYWVNNLTMPVLFAPAMRTLCAEAQPDIVVEIGPHRALEGPIKQLLRGRATSGAASASTKYLPSLLRNQNATTAALKLAGALFVAGQPLDFAAVNGTKAQVGAKPAVISDFAPYPWSAQTYWTESRSSRQRRLRPFARHDILGLLEAAYSELEPVWRNILTLDNVPWLRHHRMQNLTMFPLSGYICVALEAARQRAILRGGVKEKDIRGYRLREVRVAKAFLLGEGEEYETLVSLRPQAEGTRSDSAKWDEFRFCSWAPSRGWMEHCRCLVAVIGVSSDDVVSTPNVNESEVRRQEAQRVTNVQPINLKAFYSELEGHGAEYGPLFQLHADANLRSSGDYAICDVRMPDTASIMPYQHEADSILSPTFLDLIMQANGAILGAGTGDMAKLFIPSTITELQIRIPPSTGIVITVQAVVQRKSDVNIPGPVDLDVEAWCSGEQIEPYIQIMGLRTMPVQGEFGATAEPRPLCYKIKWEQAVTTSSKLSKTTEKEVSTTLPDITKDPFIILTERPEDDALIRELSSQLEAKTGTRPSVASLFSGMLGAHSYIVLVEMDKTLLTHMNADVFSRVQKLLLVGASTLWVTAGAYKSATNPDRNIAQGLLRTVRSETEKAVSTLDLDPHSALSLADRAALIIAALDTSLARPAGNKTVDFEFAESDGQLVVPRVVSDETVDEQLFRATHVRSAPPYEQPFEQPGRRLCIDIATPGALDSLYWKDEEDRPLRPDDIEIRPAATALNFKDVVVAMGQVSQPYIGHECAGEVSRVGAGVKTFQIGDRVCAVSPGAYGTYVRCPATSAVPIPDHLDFETAASLPVVYSTAYYSLVEIADLQPGETVLIHAAAGGVGQAAVQLAQRLGAEVYATVGSAEKKELLMATYQIPASHIFSSRTIAFGTAVRRATGGRGVDVVLNSLAGEFLRESWACIAPFGRFVDIGKRDIGTNTRLEMAVFDQSCSFGSVDMTLLAAQRPRVMRRVLEAVMRLLGMGAIKPVTPIKVMGIGELQTALRMLQSGKTTGKVVVRHGGTDLVKATHSSSGISLLPQATYIVAGGTGGLGRSIAKMMALRGAGTIVLLSRSGLVTCELQALIEDCARQGASLLVKACDIGDSCSVKAMMEEIATSLPPIRGFIHAAMVLRDVLFEKMSFDEYDAVVRCKVAGGWNMHKALQRQQQPLDFFVVLSSVAGIIGNRGQAAYAGANTFLDALVQHRRQSGMVATALNLTAVEDAGYLVENASRASGVIKNLAGNVMNEAEVLALLEMAIAGRLGAGCADQCIIGVDLGNAQRRPYYATDAKFATLLRSAQAREGVTEAVSSTAARTLAQQLDAAATQDEALEVVRAGLREKLAAILMLPAALVQAQEGATTLATFGLDSLNAIELRNFIAKEMQVHLQVLELLSSGTLVQLAGLVIKKAVRTRAWAAC